ncbi:PREDICTED: CDK5 regulatory subunit-associated protein 3-like [Amphimedon queenslandica]|uniref:CDK5 regulatory subunit-associated protein 3 n=3 Tax=Amphimedon queenslandica TaxID=400682 RepID=A0AAN0IZ11_AMPQE|nr:PREDICTED: CDK5 regulatory subunit-associated protein 3-like [Amphimedon queenslandica]|eukprot:XP_019849688.1 PREDICTED: CDK5 regulatory subunit-associated protein 3-like [Amphimedon queenslandica]
MSRLVNYEVASLKRQIARYQQQQKESTRKANDSQTNARSLKIKFEEQCQEFGIEGKDVHSELTQVLSTQLPVLFTQVESLVVHVQSALEYYQTFRESTVSSESQVLSLLSFFIKNGNVTVYEWKNGIPPPLSTDPNVKTEPESSPSDNNGELEIDWGDLGGIGEGGEPSGDIDFGDGDIDYDISLEQVDLTGITIEDGGNSLGTVSQYPTVLEDFNTRNMLLDDLMELFEFTKQRINETVGRGEGGGGGGFVLQVDLPSSVQGYSSKDIEEMSCNVSSVIDSLTNKKSQQLLLMLGSQSYLDRLSSQLIRQQELSRRASSLVSEYTYKIKEASELQTECEGSLSLLVADVKKIKIMVSKEISKKYNDRIVNITGDINQLF